MQRCHFAPEFDDDEFDPPALLFYDPAVDVDADDAVQPSTSYRAATEQMLLYEIPCLTPQPPQQQQTLLPPHHGTELVQASTFQRRRAGFEMASSSDEPLQSNHFPFESVHVLPQNAPVIVSWIDPQMAHSAIVPQTVYLSYCICHQPPAVHHQQPALQNMVVDAVRSDVQSSEQSAPGDTSSRVAGVGGTSKEPEVEALASDNEQRVSPADEELPVISPQCLDEETLKERAFEEYNAIMDSLHFEERHKKDDLLTELYKDDKKFLEYLDELCSDTTFVRTVGSELNMDYWQSLLSSDTNPLDLFAAKKPGTKEHLQQSSQSSGSGASVSYVQAPSPKADQNSSADDEEATNRLCQEILDAVASILCDSMEEAVIDEGDEAQCCWASMQEPMTALQAPTHQDIPAVRWEAIHWLLANVPQEVRELDPPELRPAGSPLLPTDRLELIQATPDDFVATFSSPFDESIYMGFHSSMLNSTPRSSDMSDGDLEALAEKWLQDSLEESKLYPVSSRAQPKLGHTSPLPLCVLALQVFLSSEQNREEEGFELATRQECSSPVGLAVSMQDVFSVGSPTPKSGTRSAFGSNRDIANDDICRNLESEMADAAQNSNCEAPCLEEEQNGEMHERQERERAVSKSKQENGETVEKEIVPLRSQRSSSQIFELGCGDDVPRITGNEKQEETLHFGHGDSEVNSPKMNALEELDLMRQSNRGRRKSRNAKEQARANSLATKYNVKSCHVPILRCRSLEDGPQKCPHKIAGKDNAKLEKTVPVVDVKEEKCQSPMKRGRQESPESEKEKTVGIWDLRQEKCSSPAKRGRQKSVNKIEKVVSNSVNKIEKVVSNSPKKANTNLIGNGDKSQSRMKAGSATSKRDVLRKVGTEEGKMASNSSQTSNNDQAGNMRSTKRIQKTPRKLPEKYQEFVAGKPKVDRQKKRRKCGRRQRKRRK